MNIYGPITPRNMQILCCSPMILPCQDTGQDDGLLFAKLFSLILRHQNAKFKLFCICLIYTIWRNPQFLIRDNLSSAPRRHFSFSPPAVRMSWVCTHNFYYFPRDGIKLYSHSVSSIPYKRITSLQPPGVILVSALRLLVCREYALLIFTVFSTWRLSVDIHIQCPGDIFLKNFF